MTKKEILLNYLEEYEGCYLDYHLYTVSDGKENPVEVFGWEYFMEHIKEYYDNELTSSGVVDGKIKRKAFEWVCVYDAIDTISMAEIEEMQGEEDSK